VRIERTIDIDAPPEIVWAVMSDVERWHEWTASITGVERLDGGAFGVCSRARVRQPGFAPAVWRVTEFTPLRGFTWGMRSLGAHAVGDHRVVAKDGGSSVTLSVDMDGWLLRLFARRLGELTRRYVETEAQGLKKRCEERARGGR
jgi:carbon monoxide dehydrogenase subunit G